MMPLDAGVCRFGTMEWNGGMERWNGILEWNGGVVNDHAHRARSVTTYTQYISVKASQLYREYLKKLGPI